MVLKGYLVPCLYFACKVANSFQKVGGCGYQGGGYQAFWGLGALKAGREQSVSRIHLKFDMIGTQCVRALCPHYIRAHH